MPLWRLPDNFSDVLPAEARQIESLRHTALETLRTWGYEMVTPPLLENLSALTTGTAQDLEAVMFKVVDPITGTLLGIRADLTPQIARIDAHLLNQNNPTRLCYCSPTLRSIAKDDFSQRELLQLGAELFGHVGIEADIEIQDLALHLLTQLDIKAPTLALSHSGVLTAVFDTYPALKTAQLAIITALVSKNQTELTELCNTYASDTPNALRLLLLLATSYGTPAEVLANRFIEWPVVQISVNTLHNLAARAITQGVNVVIDLADLSGYGYHTGVQFAIYVNGLNSSLLRGGRYDAVGKLFGRARAATGFSVDLRTLASLLPVKACLPAILAPWVDDMLLNEYIATLRNEGHVVTRSLASHTAKQGEYLCDRILVKTNGLWALQPI